MPPAYHAAARPWSYQGRKALFSRRPSSLQLDYAFLESIQSALPICDEFICMMGHPVADDRQTGNEDALSHGSKAPRSGFPG